MHAAKTKSTRLTGRQQRRGTVRTGKLLQTQTRRQRLFLVTAAKALLFAGQGEASAYAREREAAKARVAQEKKRGKGESPQKKRRPGGSNLTPAAQTCLTGSKELPKTMQTATCREVTEEARYCIEDLPRVPAR